MTYDLAERIKARLEALEKNPSGVALEAGLGRSSVRDIILGRAANPRLDTLRKLTGPLECTLDYLTGASDDPKSDSIHASYWWSDVDVVEEPDKVEAGVFRRQLELNLFDDKERPATNNSDPSANANIAYRDPRLVDWNITLYKVEDDSLELLNIIKGDIITAASHPLDHQIPLTNGLLVIVKREIRDVKVEEVSVRQVSISQGEILLSTRGKTNHDPIRIKHDDAENHSSLLPNLYFVEGGSLTIEGVVVRMTRQIPISPALEEISYKSD